MATKQELVAYLTGLQSLIEFQTTQTGDTPSGSIAREHDRVYQELHDVLVGEEEKANGEAK